MTTTDPYEFVLHDLRAQRDKIDAAIVAIEAVRGGSTRSSGTIPAQFSDSIAASEPSRISSSSENLSKPAPDASASYAGLTIYDACIKVLREEGEPMANLPLVDAIQAGGLKLNSSDPYNTIGSVLTRRFYDHGDVVRVGRGIWGLPEWYPGKDFRAEALAKRANRRGEVELVDFPENKNTTTVQSPNGLPQFLQAWSSNHD